MRIRGLDHINIRTRDLDRLCQFYISVLGLTRGPRPPFASPGAWLYANGRAIIHASVADGPANGDALPVDHFALRAEGLEDAVQRLNDAGVPYASHDIPGRAMRQIFIDDPDGVSIELNFSNPEDVA